MSKKEDFMYAYEKSKEKVVECATRKNYKSCKKECSLYRDCAKIDSIYINYNLSIESD